MRGAGFSSGSDEAFVEHDGELGLCLGPFARRHFPFLGDLTQDQEDLTLSRYHRLSVIQRFNVLCDRSQIRI